MGRKPKYNQNHVVIAVPSGYRGRFWVRSKNKIFDNDEIMVEYDWDRIIFRVATIDEKRGIRFHKASGWYSSTLSGYRKPGTYLINEEESDEDQIVVYCPEI